jgi:hypothetical protein
VPSPAQPKPIAPPPGFLHHQPGFRIAKRIYLQLIAWIFNYQGVWTTTAVR